VGGGGGEKGGLTNVGGYSHPTGTGGDSPIRARGTSENTMPRVRKKVLILLKSLAAKTSHSTRETQCMVRDEKTRTKNRKTADPKVLTKG